MWGGSLALLLCCRCLHDQQKWLLTALAPAGTQPAATQTTLSLLPLLGPGAVTETIRTGIAKLEAFQNSPDILAYGMLCALLASGIWLLVATFWELPVSTTHSIGALRTP